MTELIAAYEAYIKLLGDEVDDLSGLAHAHGWVSSRYEDGIKARERIAQAKLNI